MTRRVDEQFGRGLLDEIRALLAGRCGDRAAVRRAGVRQAMEHLRGVRDDRRRGRSSRRRTAATPAGS